MRRTTLKPYSIILGATGSVGRQAVEVLSKTNRIKIIGLACKSRSDEISKIAESCGCSRIHVENDDPQSLRDFIMETTRLYPASETTALNAISGFEGLKASFALADSKIDILMANKESIVAGGRMFLNYAKRMGIRIIPVDSEHSCIFTLSNAFPKSLIKKVMITCSGGPFRDRTDLNGITPEEAIKNPNWSMGPKISVDSSTLANKVAEIIEAKFLFNLKPEQIEAVIQKNSHVHSLIQLKNNSYIAEISVPNMSLPIAKAYGLDDAPATDDINWSHLNLEFRKPDEKRFPFLTLADELIRNHRKCIIFNAANEEAVKLFLDGKTTFTGIFEIVKKTLNRTKRIQKGPMITSLEDIIKIDLEAREEAKAVARSVLE